MASRRVSSRLQPPQEYDEEEEEEDESDIYSEDDTSSSDADTEPEVAVNLPQTLGVPRDSAIEVDEEEVNEEGSEEEEEEEIKERVENGDEKGKGDVGIELGDNSVLPTCAICMEPWTSEGPHRVCCIPCGHVYGRLCLEKWLLKCRNEGKCPQCNAKFNPKQIINLYAPRIVVPNDDFEKKARFLEEISKYMEQMRAHVEQMTARMEDMQAQIDVINDRTFRTLHMTQISYDWHVSRGDFADEPIPLPPRCNCCPQQPPAASPTD